MPASKKSRKPSYTPAQYVEGILRGDRIMLARAITLVESRRPEHQAVAAEIIDRCLPHSGQSLRLAVTGTPGAGKSTFIEAFGLQLIEKGHKVAVLAIDPSSHLSGGSILGDKTRMQQLASDLRAFIRPSPAGTKLGGVAPNTREVIFLCEAAGYDRILVETVGVGQSETAVHSMTDFFLLLLIPGAGDELQGMKRGIVEMADLIAINKADGQRLKAAQRAQKEYQRALHLFPPKPSHWTPKVLTISALHKRGIDELLQLIEVFKTQMEKSGFLSQNRQKQAVYWLHERIDTALRNYLQQQPEFKKRMLEAEEKVAAGTWSSLQGSLYLLEALIKRN